MIIKIFWLWWYKAIILMKQKRKVEKTGQQENEEMT